MSEGYRLKNWQEKITYWYDLEGKLISIADRFDNRTNFHYEGKCLSRMETASGQTLSFSYESGKLKTITTGDGRSLKYEYEQDFRGHYPGRKAA